MHIETSGKRLKKKYDLSKLQGVRDACMDQNADLLLVRNFLDWNRRLAITKGLKSFIDRSRRW